MEEELTTSIAKVSETASSRGTSTPQLINLNQHKAGLEGLDKERINQIIQEASKGSNFYSFQQKRQKRINSQISHLKSKLAQISDNERANAEKKADIMLVELEECRVLNKIIVHFDMDMFFAAVEIKNNPDLADKPIAVGSMSMISTSNYVARRFGVRSAMAGFIGKKLCPELRLIKPNFRNYKKESEFIMNILSEYDPKLRNFSLDEVYIDLTDYVFTKFSEKNDMDITELFALTELSDDIWNFSYDIVNEIRRRIANESKLTVSAGICCNTMLAKVCTDINKPDGQFMIKGHKSEIMNFVSQTELRKFCGIGPVKGQVLSAFNIIHGSDIYKDRALLVSLFSELNVISYLRIYLGIGSSFLEGEDGNQKSHSRERTVGELSDFNDICNLLSDISHRVSKDLKNHGQQGKTITLKLKKISFDVFLKSRSICFYTDDEKVIFKTGKELLAQEMSKNPQNKYRLIGIKVSNLQEIDPEVSSQLTLSQLLKQAPKNNSTINESLVESEELILVAAEQYVCQLCEEIFEDNLLYEMHKSYCDGNLNELGVDDLIEENWRKPAKMSVGEEQERGEHFSESFRREESSIHDDSSIHDVQYFTCPICKMYAIFSDNDELNRHIDTCLNKDLCAELTRLPCSTSPKTASSALTQTNSSTKKRKSLNKAGSSKTMKKAKITPTSNGYQKKLDEFFQ